MYVKYELAFFFTVLRDIGVDRLKSSCLQESINYF